MTELQDELAVVLVDGFADGAPEGNVPMPPLANFVSQLIRAWLPDPS